MKSQKINTIIIGAGQAGLSVSYCLTQKGIDHLILEKGKIAEDWRSKRWDNFHLITPNYMTRLPGFSYRGNNPKGFDTRDQMIKFFESYAKTFNSPIKENTQVLSVSKSDGEFLVKTNKNSYLAKNVVVAIGSFHKPQVPEIAKNIPNNIFQIHSSLFKNSKQLPQGAALIVGGGNSGIQIAYDLNKAGRKVYLSVGRLRIVPRIYRGKDFMEWVKLMGSLDKTAEEATPEIKSTIPPALFGKKETINLKKLAKEGMQLLGRLKEFKGDKLMFENDLQENLEKGENALVGFKKAVDQFAHDKKIKAPKDKELKVINFKPEPLLELDVKGISTIIWATGFVDDYSFLKIPVFNEDGQPIHEKGVSEIPGLYFIGLRWLSKYQSFLICGVAEDAEYLAKQISE